MTIINLNKHRKQRQRSQDEQRAAENRVRFGRTKALRIGERREREQAKRDIDGKRLD